jgi:hypothetical protein
MQPFGEPHERERCGRERRRMEERRALGSFKLCVLLLPWGPFIWRGWVMAGV